MAFGILLFCLVIFGANVIQGITGFAGTLIAMPFLIFLVDMDLAKQVLNATGILASLYIVIINRSYVDIKTTVRILSMMLIGMLLGLFLYQDLPSNLLLVIFSFFTLIVAILGLYQSIKPKQRQDNTQGKEPWYRILLLFFSGLMHGLFVAGGPLLITYLSRKHLDKQRFRVILSSVWLVLNTMMFVQGMLTHQIQLLEMKYIFYAMIPLLLGVAVGNIVAKHLSQKVFMLMTYILLICSSISLLLK